jgi:hypothetical protein
VFLFCSYVSIDLFVSSLSAKSKMRALLEVVAAASEFDQIPVRHHEATKLRKLAAHLPMKLDSTSFADGRSKINVRKKKKEKFCCCFFTFGKKKRFCYSVTFLDLLFRSNSLKIRSTQFSFVNCVVVDVLLFFFFVSS